MSKHNEDRIHWAKMLKVIEEKVAIPIYKLAEEFDVESEDEEFQKTLQQLREQGKIREMMGYGNKNMLCVLIMRVDDDLPRTKRS